jgi:LysR family transcriptional regulator for metE and metH
MIRCHVMQQYHAVMDLELKHLRLVSAVARTGSVTRAGEILHLSQSALSHQLRDIEDRLGAPLFHRVGKKMIATPAGESLLRVANDVLSMVTRAEDEARRSGSGPTRLRITTECNTCYHWLPSVLKEYRLRHPRVDVQVDGPAMKDPLPALLDGRLDLAFVSQRVRDRRIVERPLFEDELLVIMPPGHRLTNRPFVSPRDFADESVIVYPPVEESTILQKVLAPAGVTPRAITQVMLSEAIIELVKAGLGIAAMGRWTIEPHIRSGAVRALPLGRKGFRRQWGAAVLRDMAEAPFMRDFIDLLASRPPEVVMPEVVRAVAGSRVRSARPTVVHMKGKGSVRSFRTP